MKSKRKAWGGRTQGDGYRGNGYRGDSGYRDRDGYRGDSGRGDSGYPRRAGGNPNVIDEAERKRGGRAKKRATGGKVAGVAPAEPATKSVGLMTGGGVKPRLDRPGRKQGGRVGANTSPLSTAHNVSSPSSLPKSQQGRAS